jgi:hypothetical protein
MAPAGQVAFFHSPSVLERFAALFASSAYAGTSGLVSVPDGTPVQLGRITSGGAFSVLATASTSAGLYSFNLTSAGLTFANDLIAQVANPTSGVRMRAFVTGANVDITPSSESAVQEVLDLIAATSGVSLSNFTLEELKDVRGAIDALTESSQMSSGPNINSTISSIRNAIMSEPEIVAYLTSAAAVGQTTEGPGDVGNFVPVAQGTAWTYQGTEQSRGQAPISYSNTVTAVGTKMFGSVLTLVREDSNALNNGGPTEEYYTKNSRGMTYHGSDDPTDSLSPQIAPYMELRFPLAPGLSFEEVDKTGLDYGEDLDGDSVNERLDLKSIVTVKGYESITVPAGSYPNCAIVERRGTFTVILSRNGQTVTVPVLDSAWYAPGVGVVRNVARIGDQTVTEELSSFGAAPIAVDDTFNVPVDTLLFGDLSTNDTGSPDGGNVWALATAARNGVAVVSADGTFDYTPAANYSGTDSFAYTITDADGDISTAVVTITVVPGNLDVTVLNLPGVSDLVVDPTTQTIYAAATGNPGTVTPIDPVTKSTGTAIPVGVDPVKLARSDDGKYLYVGLRGQPSVQRIDLSTQAVDLTFSLGDDPTFGHPYFAEDIEVLPGSPQSVAVSRSRGGSPRHGGVAVYDDGVQRTTTTPDHTGSNVIEFSESAATLYGYNNETSEFGFRRMAIDSSGVTVSDVFTSFMGDLIYGFGVDIQFHGGLIYTTSGRVIDPVVRSVLGTFSLPTTFDNLVEADSAIGRVFFLNSFGRWTIRAFDMATRQQLGGVTVSGVTGDPGSLIRWGSKGLVFRTSGGQVFLVESPDLIP